MTQGASWPRFSAAPSALRLIPSPSGLGSRLAVGPPGLGDRRDPSGSHADTSGLGSRLAAGPLGLASMAILQCHFFLNLPQASRLLPRHAGAGGMTKGRVAFTSAAVIGDGQSRNFRIREIRVSFGSQGLQRLDTRGSAGGKVRSSQGDGAEEQSYAGEDRRVGRGCAK
jgi:hypothetical protein